ncbi:MAG TPA: chemotaxis protein CheB [Candidatus Aquilonibacter sp.]|nr:chemotaxis protein CheB [Candidatus Aquilonibacter sp.]
MQPISDCRFPIVCLGGSAGSLEPYREILRHIPNDSGMAFVIVSHRAPDNPEMLGNLLSRAAQIPVIEITDAVPLAPACVFVKPARTDLTTDGLLLRMQTSSPRRGWPVDISRFLLSLARVCSSRVVAVILSGMGYDGSSALRAVKVAGGTVFAQSDALYGDMPQCAIDTGYVDFTLSATKIGQRLAEMRPKSPPARGQ